jgi:AmiR/NasT family two-component response regulator
LILKQTAGCEEVIERPSVAAAMPIYTSETFDFTMVDISRPSDELRELLHVSRKKQKTPVLAFTTGALSRETLQLLVEDHVFAVFPKPFDIEPVASSVSAAIEATREGTLHPKLHGFLEKLHK